MNNKNLEHIYRFKVKAEIPYFESRYYAKRFLDEIIPPYLRDGAVIRRTAKGFVISVLGPIYKYVHDEDEFEI